MDYAEEVAMEMEALASIFGDNFEQKSSNLCVILAEPNADETHIACFLEWTLPDNYPDAPPALVIQNKMGVTEKWNHELHEALMASCDDLAGTPMIFSLVELAREWLTDKNVKGVGEESMHSQMLAREHEKQREKEQAKAAEAKSEQVKEQTSRRKQIDNATPVTSDSFLAWMNIRRAKEDVELRARQTKPTGRQLFEGGNLQADDGEHVEGEDFDAALMEEEDVPDDLLDSDAEECT